MNQLPYLQEASATLKFNTLDLTLVDPATIPAIGNAVALTDPTWAGTVVSITRRPGPRPGHDFATISATNTDTAGASAGPFGLSDAPSPPTTYGYDQLAVQTSHNLDGTDTVKGSLVLYQTGLWPAMTFTLTNADLGYSAANFSVTDVTVTWIKGVPRYSMSFGDPLVTMSVWLNSESAGILPITRTKITDGEVTTPALAANAVTTDILDAGSVTADKLAATLILGSTIIAGDPDGANVTLSGSGLTAYDASSVPQVIIPSDGSPVTVRGEIEASTLVSTTSATLGGTTLIPPGSTLEFAEGVTAPTAPPTLTVGWDAHTLAVPTLAGYSYASTGSGYYDAAGGTSGTTACYVAYVRWTKGGLPAVHQVIEWKISDWTVDRQTTITGGIGLTLGSDEYCYGLTRIGTSWYLTSTDGTDSKVHKITRSTGAVTSYGSKTGVVYYDIATNGTSLYCIELNRLVHTWNATVMSYVSSTTLTGLTGATAGIEHDGTDWWISEATSPKYVHKVTVATGAAVANTKFPMPTSTGNARAGVYWDGSAFHSATNYGPPQTIVDYTGWTWTTESALYWVGYSWYDSDATGGTHETEAGPRASITMGRRQRLQVLNAPIPDLGGTDDPNNVRVYMERNASEPAAGGYKLQVTDALTARYLTTFATGGAADPTTNGFLGLVGLSVITGLPSKVTKYTSGSGTWTKPVNIHHVIVECVGGGGGGGATTTTGGTEASSSAGGGGGGYARKLFTAAVLTQTSYSYSVGAGGTAGAVAGGTGGTGGNSTFSGTGITTVQGNGGTGGQGEGATAGDARADAGLGGTASGGDVNLSGSDGGDGRVIAGTYTHYCVGGSSGAGFGGTSRAVVNGAGNAGNAYGGGGSGNALSSSQTQKAGGAGAAGVVIVTEFFGP